MKPRMDLESLIHHISLKIVDPYSVDTITRSITKLDGLRREELLLKETGSPSPRLETYGNIPCVMVGSLKKSTRTALLVVSEEGTKALVRFPFLEDIADEGLNLIVVDAVAESTARTVARVLRVVSYADLRRDIIDHARIFLCGLGRVGVWGLVAAAVDERVSGVVAVNVPASVSLPASGSLMVAEIAGLVAPRKLAIVGASNPEKVFARTIDAYKRKTASLRFEKEDSDVVRRAVSWMIQEGVS